MNRTTSTFISRLTLGDLPYTNKKTNSHGIVETLAQAYEKARNALEYRADNLVRRAAVERMLKRSVVLNPEAHSMAKNLLKELRWAKYLSFEESKEKHAEDLSKILQKYLDLLGGEVPQEWIIKVASAQIEEYFNLNRDYKQFTLFAFKIIEQKIRIKDDNLDLLIFYAVDKIYSESDDEQILYHILKIGDQEITKDKLSEAWRLFILAKNHKELPRIIKYVRRQMPPLVLLRDIYFYDPVAFKETVTNEDKFFIAANETLENQLSQMSDKIKTAGARSIIYVFLTKMVLAFLVEVPFEIFIYGSLGKLPLLVNLIFPPLLMWLATMQIALPSEEEREALMQRSWFIVQNSDELSEEEDFLEEVAKDEGHSFGYYVFTTLYAFVFLGVFALIYFGLDKIGFTFFSKAIFVFFLTIIAFFAYRIVQIAKIYSWKGPLQEKSNLFDVISLPILTIGSRLSKGLSKLNFLAFAFDFILEAPFKIILRFVDDWVQFLSLKKEEQILE